MPELPELLTVDESAERLRCGVDKVWRLIRSGELRSLKIGGSRRITVDALADFIARAAAATPEPGRVA